MEKIDGKRKEIMSILSDVRSILHDYPYTVRDMGIVVTYIKELEAERDELEQDAVRERRGW